MSKQWSCPRFLLTYWRESGYRLSLVHKLGAIVEFYFVLIFYFSTDRAKIGWCFDELEKALSILEVLFRTQKRLFRVIEPSCFRASTALSLSLCSCNSAGGRLCEKICPSKSKSALASENPSKRQLWWTKAIWKRAAKTAPWTPVFREYLAAWPHRGMFGPVKWPAAFLFESLGR